MKPKRTRATGQPTLGQKPATLARKHSTRATDRQLRFIGIVRSTIKTRSEAPRQGSEGAPDAWLEVKPAFVEGLDGIAKGDALIVITWLHKSERATLKVRRRRYDDPRLWGVFATRSPDRPNPLGLHRVTVRHIRGSRLRVGPIEVIDKTPVVDIKPVLEGPRDS